MTNIVSGKGNEHVYLARATVQCVLAEVDLLNIAGRQVKQIKCLESVLL